MLFRAVLLLVSTGFLAAVSLGACAAGDGHSSAEEVAATTAEGRAPAASLGAIYIPLKPAFVVNYGGPGRLRYIKVDISLRLRDNAAANSVRHHMPYIRNNLVMLFSAQTDESISSQEGKEALRQEVLQVVRDVIMQEDQAEGVVDLYFNAFLIQK
jgi:flagellar FliL protein